MPARNKKMLVDHITNSIFIAVKANGRLRSKLMSLRGRIARAAQRVYDDWDPEWYGGGGICDDVSGAISDIIASSIHDIDLETGGQPGSDHASVLVYNDEEAFDVDIPARIYERGGGFRWERLPDVRITAGDVYISEVDRRYI